MSLRQSVQAIACVALFSFLAACGDDKPGLGPGAATAVDANGNCTPGFEQEGNKLAADAREAEAAQDLNKIEKLVNAFHAKYAGVKCKNSDGEAVDVDAEVAAVRAQIKKAREGGAAPGDEGGEDGGDDESLSG